MRDEALKCLPPWTILTYRMLHGRLHARRPFNVDRMPYLVCKNDYMASFGTSVNIGERGLKKNLTMCIHLERHLLADRLAKFDKLVSSRLDST